MLPLLLLAATAAAAMETRETVQRVVLLRTTGSDLQPAATGFIYNKRGDEPESLVRMGDSEVMEHLAKLYPSGERVIPVREQREQHADGLADVDYEQIFRDYRANYGGGRHHDYLRDSRRFKGGDGAGDSGSYNNAKFESYSISRAHQKDHDDGDTHKKHYRGSEHAARGTDDARGFRGVYGDIYDKDQEHGQGVAAFTDEHDSYHGAGGRYKHYGYEPEHQHAHAGRGAAGEASAEERRDSDSAEGPASPADSAAGAVRERTLEGDSYGYKVEH